MLTHHGYASHNTKLQIQKHALHINTQETSIVTDKSS